MTKPMHIWTDLLAREAALFAVLLALGSGPAALLSERFDAAGRITLAPILGFCLGTCVATSLLEFFPVGQTYWTLVPLALLSLAVAALRTLRSRSRRAPGRPHLRELAHILIVCAAVAGPLTYALHERHTVGPVAYSYTDVDSYVGEQDGAQTTSIQRAREIWTSNARSGTSFGDLTQWDWSFLSFFDGNLDAAPLDANVNALLGLGATDTFGPFLVVLLLAGALGAFAAVRYTTRTASRARTWPATVAAALFGGPLFLELWFDSYQAAIVALALLMPLALLSAESLRSRRWANFGLLALVLACLLTVYPLFVPMFVLTAAIVLGWLAFTVWRRGESIRALGRPTAVRIGAVAVMAIVFDPVGVTRDIHYYGKVIDNTVPLPRVGWHLPVDVLPGWLLQTREFWYLPSLGTGGFKQILLGAVLPLVFVGFIVIGVRRHRQALALVAFAGVCATVAEYAYASREACTYCAERDLLPLGPILAVLLALGLSAVFAMPRRWARAVGIAGAVLVAVAVGQRTRVELTRFTNGSYFLDSANRAALSHLPRKPTAVQLEGFGQTLSAQAEQPLIYHLANERARGRISIPLASNMNNALEYLDFGVVKVPGLEFHPSYDYVLTRFAGIATDRQVVARSGGIALERRNNDLDVTPVAGLNAPLARLDPSGTAWAQSGIPIQLYVTGVNPARVWIRLTFRTSSSVGVASQPGIHTRQRAGMLVVCIPSTGKPPVRYASVKLSFAPTAGAIPHESFPPATPQEGVTLEAMRAVAGRCAV